MVTFSKHKADHPGSSEKKFSDGLRRYDYADFSIQQRARFLYFLSIAVLLGTIIIISYSGYVQLTSPNYGKLYFPVLASEIAYLLVVIFSIIMLRQGHFSMSAHLLLISSLITVWTVIWFDKNEPVARLDTIVMIPAILTILPLLIKKRRIFILLYVFVNIIVLFVFLNRIRGTLDIPESSVYDFIADFSIAIAFIGVVGYSLYRINNRSLEKAVSDIRKRMEAEKALSESERNYKELSDLLPQTIFETDLTGKLTYVNKTSLGQFGYTEEDVQKGLNVLSLLIENDRKSAFDRFSQTIDGGKSHGNHYTAIKKDGTRFPIQIYATSIEKNQKIVGVRGIVIDITNQVKAEEEIKKSRDQYQSLVSNIPGITYRYLFDTSWTMLYISSEIEKLSGYPPDEFIANNVRTFDSIIHKDDRQYVLQETDQSIKSSKSWEIEYRIIHCDNSIRWVFEKGRAIRNKTGDVEYLDGFILDITNRKLAEKSLKESEEKYRTLMEHMNEAVMMVDNNDRVQYINKKFTEILGYRPEEIIGKVGYTLLFDPDDQEIIEYATDLRKNRQVKMQYEVSFTSKDGQKIYFLVSAAPLINSDGIETGSIVAMVDISARKIAEGELEQHRTNLEIIVNERTKELETINEELKATNEELYIQHGKLEVTLNSLKEAQTKLVQSEKMASLGVLAAGVAHEINNPLNFIYAGVIGLENYFSENLKDKSVEVAPMIEGIQVGVKRAADIVTSLNHFSRRDDLPNSECRVTNVIENCLVMINNQVKNRIEVIRDFNAQEDSVLSNEGRLHQVFLNILVNSVQAIHDKGTIRITTRAKKGRIIISISDTGCGISREILPKITDPFFTTKDPGKGTGLGLSITYDILKEYDGTLDFESEQGAGTTVVITLPQFRAK